MTSSVIGQIQLTGFADFIAIGDQSIWTGVNIAAEPGIGLIEVIGRVQTVLSLGDRG